MKNNRNGKAAIFTSDEIGKIRKSFIVSDHRCLFELALFTGERMGAIVKLKVSDVYRDASKSIPHDEITFTARTRKARPDGTRETRQVPINDDLKSFLKSYKPPETGYLFPGSGKSGLTSENHLTVRAVDKYWRQQFFKIGLDYRGFSTHSPRRWLIYRLAGNGVSLGQIKAIMGHKNTEVLMGYIDATKEQVRGAIAAVTV